MAFSQHKEKRLLNKRKQTKKSEINELQMNFCFAISQQKSHGQIQNFY